MTPKKPSLDLSSPAGRLGWLLQKIWLGSQSRMAAEIGVKQGSLSNVLTGKRAPGRDMLTAASAHPLVNPAWLLTGNGEPLQQDVVLGEAALPVARQPFAGLPHENQGSLEAFLHPVPRHLYRLSRYWVAVTEGHPLLHYVELKIAVGDLVLFEADATQWPTELAKSVSIVEVEQNKFGFLAYAPVVKESDGEFYAETEAGGPRERTRPIIVNDEPVGSPTKNKRKRTRARIVAVGIYRCGSLPLNS